MIVHLDGNTNDKNFKIRNSTVMLQHVIGLKAKETLYICLLNIYIFKLKLCSRHLHIHHLHKKTRRYYVHFIDKEAETQGGEVTF